MANFPHMWQATVWYGHSLKLSAEIRSESGADLKLAVLDWLYLNKPDEFGNWPLQESYSRRVYYFKAQDNNLADDCWVMVDEAAAGNDPVFVGVFDDAALHFVERAMVVIPSSDRASHERQASESENASKRRQEARARLGQVGREQADTQAEQHHNHEQVSLCHLQNQQALTDAEDSELAEQLEREHRERRIRKFVQERNIGSLVHFTRLENLTRIMSEGLVSRIELEKRTDHLQPKFNDSFRIDDHHDWISLSIGFPNYKLFYRFRQSYGGDWVVVVLKPEILWQLDCLFYQTNAASNEARYRPDEQQRMPEELFAFYEDYSAGDMTICRKQLRLPQDWPTNPQAEVLVRQGIPASYVSGIHFENAATARKWIAENGQPASVGCFSSNHFFRPRHDHRYW